MSGRKVKTAGFLTATAIAIGWELVASFDNDVDTVPWTDLIVENIPAELTIAAIGALILWLPAHFGLRYYRKARGRQGDNDGNGDE